MFSAVMKKIEYKTWVWPFGQILVRICRDPDLNQV